MDGTCHYYPDSMYTRLWDGQALLQETTEQELSKQAAELINAIAA